MTMALESKPFSATVEIEDVRYTGREVWGTDGLVEVVFDGDGISARSDIFAPEDLSSAWEQAESKLRWMVANRYIPLELF